ncbi:Phage integrase family protein [Flavobacterium gillisiae]|uniref:Phage integrase family protein n=1 Tax=Flavobacterium gillisiae TaxID=150146 RepID=A0A1H3WTC5_9FLAO|nr:tyrosine-type recombinase/integrase [Flavobacterium gillisiae]SDZ90373.1 Phage integrase family protein [Flavobacterium gillisiae]
MKSFDLIIRNEPTSEPIKIQIKVGMRDFSEVKLYIPKVNGKPSVLPNHRWYVYYYFRNPNTGKMDKFQDYCKINRYKTVIERKEVGTVWVNAYTTLLNQGLNPFVEASITPKVFEEKTYSIKEALQYAYDNKLGSWKVSTADDYRVRMNVFLEWVCVNKLEHEDIRDLKELHVIAFMNWLIKPLPKGRGVGGTSQDNYKRCLSGLFGKLVKDKITATNFFLEIDTKKDDPIKNKPFTGYQVKEIRDYLLIHDKQLYHFIQFVIFTFLRQREIIRLTVSDINLREKYLTVETKTKRKQVKKLVGPIVNFFEGINIADLPSKANVFTNTAKFEVWTASEKSKVDHFGHRFGKVKTHFGFNHEYGIYSFRHTAALDLFHSYLKKGFTEREVILKMLPITGHATETALRKYLRDVGGMLPKDYGEDYTLEF